jgi:hypothetical protein
MGIEFRNKTQAAPSDAYSAPSKAVAPVRRAGATRTYSVAAGGEAEQLTLAFLRYVELHGRTLVGPKSRCSIAAVPGEGVETRIFTFWSRRAAAGFDVFWRRYRPIYGAPNRPCPPDRQERL